MTKVPLEAQSHVVPQPGGVARERAACAAGGTPRRQRVRRQERRASAASFRLDCSRRKGVQVARTGLLGDGERHRQDRSDAWCDGAPRPDGRPRIGRRGPFRRKSKARTGPTTDFPIRYPTALPDTSRMVQASRFSPVFRSSRKPSSRVSGTHGSDPGLSDEGRKGLAPAGLSDYRQTRSSTRRCQALARDSAPGICPRLAAGLAESAGGSRSEKLPRSSMTAPVRRSGLRRPATGPTPG
jgi:hypothetical protein